jgi:hypothetical protein
MREHFKICSSALCVPGMGMILSGASPVYIFWREVITTTLKSTSRRQGGRREPTFERSPSANLRADGQKPDTRPNPWVSKHNFAKPVQRIWGMVNQAVVEGKIMQLPGEICQPRPAQAKVGTLPVKGRVKRQKSAEVENLGLATKGKDGRQWNRRCP